MKEAGSTPPVSASSIFAAGAASSPGRTLALSSPQPEPTSPCPQSPQTPPLDPRGDVNGYPEAENIRQGEGRDVLEILGTLCPCVQVGHSKTFEAIEAQGV